MAGRQRDRFRERDRRRDSRYKDYYDRRSPSPYSSNDEERDNHRDNYNNNNNYNNRRRYSNDRDSWHDQRRSNRNERYRSRSRERSQSDRYDNYDNGSNHDQYERKKEEIIPNNTIMVRNLGLTINENEIECKLTELGLKCKEIRLMRKKDSGESRGFAFVEFNDVSEATYWKNQTQGHVTFSDGQQASLHYSIPKDSLNSDRNQQKTDWTCYKCGVVNFKRRDVCFKCSTTREESAANETGDEISPMPTNCLLFRNLNPYTTEERILTILGTLTTLPIKSIKIPKENSISLCVCFVELYTTQEAAQIFSLLSTLTSGFIVDDFPIAICYAKRNVPNSNGMNTTGLKNAATLALAAAQWTNQKETSSNSQQSTTQINQQHSLPIQTSSINQPTNIQIVVPFNAPVLTNGVDYGHVTINNQTYRKFPIPDASTYQLEETSGFYYDSLTCLYYDPNSHYYYNGTTQKYMYWSNDYQTYLPVDTQQAATTNINNINEQTSKVAANGNSSTSLTKDDSKTDKVKIAKKIAKDMEKWAKSLNQKSKEATNKQQSSTSSNQSDNLTSTASSGGYNSLSLGNTGISLNISNVKEDNKSKLLEKSSIFEAGDDEEETDLRKGIIQPKIKTAKASPERITTSVFEEDKEKLINQKLNLTDWNKLICLLCKRQFNSKEQLSKHQQASELHKANLYKVTGINFSQEQIAELSKNDGEFNFNYRDRAKERRLKYGQSDQPEVPSSRYKEKYMRSIKSAFPDDYSRKYETTPPNQDTLQNSIGVKLLGQMGWSHGQGLGKSNQGRSSLIEVERRAAGVGLGVKTTSHPSGESYKDAVKRTMIERYKELHEKEMAKRMNSS